ncbi:hypothetical protein ACP4OV_001550 [Aristida adscensionis]
MASLTQPTPLVYSPSSSGLVVHAARPAPGGRGSFGPVLLVLAVISFLSVAACVAGRVCGRGRSLSGRASSSEQQSAEADKGSIPEQLAIVMRPVPSSRATVHDIDDAFEIKVLPPLPPPAMQVGLGREAGGMTRPKAPPQQLGLSRKYAAATAGVRIGVQ